MIIVTRIRRGVQSNLEWIGLCMAMKRSMLTNDPNEKQVDRKRKTRHILPAINVKMETATDVPRGKITLN